jgi:site-specific DNA recombinase
LAEAPTAVIALHPGALAHYGAYGAQLGHLQEALARAGTRDNEDVMLRLVSSIRDLVETVTVRRDGSEGGIEVTIAGRLNALLGEKASPNGLRAMYGLVVAEDGFEPPTRGL